MKSVFSEIKLGMPLPSSRITQLLLGVLILTQVPNCIRFVQGLNRFESPEAAFRACRQWAEMAGQYTVKRTGLWTQYSQSPVRLCTKEGDHYLGMEIPLDHAKKLSPNFDDPKGFLFNRIPKAEDTGKRWRFKRDQWSINIPL